MPTAHIPFAPSRLLVRIVSIDGMEPVADRPCKASWILRVYFRGKRAEFQRRERNAFGIIAPV